MRTYALTAAANQGKQWAGFKLVEGRSSCKYSSETAVTQALDNAGVTGYTKTSLLGITDMTKLLGKKKFTELLGDLVVKPQGKPQLVPLSDKRPALCLTDATIKAIFHTFEASKYLKSEQDMRDYLAIVLEEGDAKNDSTCTSWSCKSARDGQVC